MNRFHRTNRRELSRLIETLETVNGYVARHRLVIFSYAASALKGDGPLSQWMVEELINIAERDPSEHYRGLASDALWYMREMEL